LGRRLREGQKLTKERVKKMSQAELGFSGRLVVERETRKARANEVKKRGGERER
jgi:hypothetical protein